MVTLVTTGNFESNMSFRSLFTYIDKEHEQSGWVTFKNTKMHGNVIEELNAFSNNEITQLKYLKILCLYRNQKSIRLNVYPYTHYS